MNRVGYHFRSQIVQSAMESLGIDAIYHPVVGPHGVEVIPDSQQEINKQANAALVELFPKIPHTDRAEIISHAFRKVCAPYTKYARNPLHNQSRLSQGQATGSEPLVGLQPSLSLFRRVQLAVLAHIRHNHTRYDKLLKETSWSNARRVTEEVCLDFLVKWRGDDESGRDQLDEIIREVVVLSDDDDSDDEEEDSTSEVEHLSSRDVTMQPPGPASLIPGIPSGPAAIPYGESAINGFGQPPSATERPPEPPKPKGKSKKALQRERRKNRKGFKRYEANNKRYEAAWENALRRNREAADAKRTATPNALGSVAAQNGFASHGSSPRDPPVHMNRADLSSHGFNGEPLRYRNARTPQGGPGPGPASGLGPHSGAPHAPSSLAYEYPAAEYAPQSKVVEPAFGGGAHARAWPVAAQQTLLQDMLHPSIEPISPGVPLQEQSYRSMMPAPYPARQRPADPSREVIVIHESSEPEPEPSRLYPSLPPRHEEQHARRFEPEVRYEEYAPDMYRDGPRHPGPWDAAAAPMGHGVWGEGQAYADRVHPGHAHVMGHQPGLSRPHQEDFIVRDERPRVERPIWPAQDVHSHREGFMVLREQPPSQRLPQNEPFIQLREAPVIYPDLGAPRELGQRMDPHHTYVRVQDVPDHVGYTAGEARYLYHEPPQAAAYGQPSAYPRGQL